MTARDELERAIERADYIANVDSYYGDRDADVARHLARAGVLGLAVIAEQLERLGDTLDAYDRGGRFAVSVRGSLDAYSVEP